MKIFISYAREDYNIAKRLFDDLKNFGFSPWLDKENILIGQDWKLEIRKAIKESSYFIALLSVNSVSKRGYFQKELKLALEVLDELPQDQIFLLPIRIDDCSPIDEKLQNIHWGSLTPSYEEGIKDIYRVIEQSSLIFQKYFRVTATNSERLIELSKKAGMHDIVINYLLKSVNRKDPTERYWIYITFGEIGGEKAKLALEKGCSDEDDFARKGAFEALEL